MYKNASHNAQVRERRQALEGRANTAGIDPSTFKPDDFIDARGDLTVRKKEIEFELRQLKTSLAQARQSPVSRTIKDQWHARRVNLISETQAIDIRLSKLKTVSLHRSILNDSSFSEAFVAAAKDILADDVFDRVFRVAAMRARIVPA